MSKGRDKEKEIQSRGERDDIKERWEDRKRHPGNTDRRERDANTKKDGKIKTKRSLPPKEGDREKQRNRVSKKARKTEQIERP